MKELNLIVKELKPSVLIGAAAQGNYIVLKIAQKVVQKIVKKDSQKKVPNKPQKIAPKKALLLATIKELNLIVKELKIVPVKEN